MAIVNKPKVNGIYYVSNRVLGIQNAPDSRGHLVVVTSINKSRKTANVKTITSLASYDSKYNKWKMQYDKIDDLAKGKILPIPITQLGTRKYSGINHEIHSIKFKDLSINTISRIKFPKRYEKLIHKK